MLLFMRLPRLAMPGIQPSSDRPAKPSGTAEADLAARGQEGRTRERCDAAALAQHLSGNFGIDAREAIHRPYRDQQHDDAEDNGTHTSVRPSQLICRNSFCAPPLRRAERSVSAFMPPAA